MTVTDGMAPSRGAKASSSPPPDIIQGKVLSEVIAEDSYSSIYILNLDDSYGNGLAENLTSSFEETGGEVIDAVVVPVNVGNAATASAVAQ